MKQSMILLIILVLAMIGVGYALYKTKLPLARWIGVTFLGEADEHIGQKEN